VIEIRRLPGGCRVTGFASLREAALDVIWILGALVVLQVTGHAGGLRNVVVVVDMAIGALPRWHSMLTGQRES